MADTLDLLTLTEGKAALNETTTDRDTEIAQYITAVSRRLDELCGAIVKRTVSDELHPGGSDFILLRQAPASASSTTSITSVYEYTGGTATTLTAETVSSASSDNYSFNTELGQVRRRSSWTGRSFLPQNVVVTYAAGRYANTAAVDAKFKTAAAVMLQHLWRPGQGFGGSYSDAPLSGFAVPHAVLELLADELQGPVVA